MTPSDDQIDPLSIGARQLQELKALGDLPSPKGAALAVMRLTRRDDVPIPELARAVQTDPALVGRLIKVANSAQLGTRRPVVAVTDAMIVLGIQAVRNLALGLSLLSNHRGGPCVGLDYGRFWSYSLACAVAAQAIAAQTRTAAPGEAFSLGLLSRIGELALATVFPCKYAHILTQQADTVAQLAALEREAFAVTHADLTAAMLADWGIPRLFVEAAAAHETPDQVSFLPDTRSCRLMWTLVLARRIADICLAADDKRHGMMPQLLLAGSKLSLDGEVLMSLCDQVACDWRDWAGMLGVDAHAMPPFDELSRQPPSKPDLDAAGMPQVADGPLRALVVDDDESIRAQLRKMLTDAGYQVSEAGNGQEGFDKALDVAPHILITEWRMPELDGIEMTRALRQTRVGRAIYILILTTLDAENELVAAFDAGIDDYLTKPLNPRVLGARLRAGQRVVMLQEEIAHDHEDIKRFAAELAVTNRRLGEAALTDVLTGCYNRRYANERFRQEWRAADRSGRPLSCLLIDVDYFKAINDSYGHDIGDRALRQAAETIQNNIRAQAVVCRTGGDEFTVICPESDLAAALACGERVRKAMAESEIVIGADRLKLSLSIGVAMRDAGTPDIEALIKCADEGIYKAKQLGRNCVVAVQAINSLPS